MSSRALDIADFHEQLALLVRSSLPLPECLYQLGKCFGQRGFGAAIRKIGEATERGEKLSEAVKHYPSFFGEFHVRLMVAAEESGTLPEVLFVIGRFSRFTQLMMSRAREVLAYPLLTLNISGLVLLFIFGFVIPEFEQIYVDMLEGGCLPSITDVTVRISRCVRAGGPMLPGLYAAFLLFSIWIFMPCRAARTTLLKVVEFLPGSCGIARSMDAARLCGMGATFLRQHMAIPESLAMAARMMERKRLQHALRRVEAGVRAGGSLVDLLTREEEVDPLVPLTLRDAPEDKLAAELAALGGLFEQRVALAARSATLTWGVLGLITMTLAVGFVIVSLFMPLIRVVMVLSQ